MKRAICLVAAVFIVSGKALSQETRQEASSLPPLPTIAPESFPPSLREKVQEAYTQALTHPTDPEANGRLGMVLQAYDPPDSNAEICYRRARAFDPSSFRWAYYLGLIQWEQKRYPEAAATFEGALKTRPHYLPAELKLGQCFLRSGDIEAARRTFEGALGDHPHSAQVYFELGKTSEASGDLTAAETSFRRAIELFPHFGAVHYALALAHQRLGEAIEVRDEFTLAEKYKYESPDAEDPLMADLRTLYTDPQYFMARGLHFADQGRWEEAAVEHEKALWFDSNLLQAHVNLISLYGHLRAFDEAEKHYRAAIAIDPRNTQACYDYGILLLEQDKFQEAERAFRKTLEFDPHHAQAHNNLGDLLQRQGKLTEARAEFQKAIHETPDFPQAHFNLGRILVNQGNYTEGIPELIKTLSTTDEDAKTSYLYAVGAAYARSGDREKGLRYLRTAREQAAARHQPTLLENIDRDLKIVETQNRLE